MQFATVENLYECGDCGALQGERQVDIIKLEEVCILVCCVCNSKNIKLHKTKIVAETEN